MKIISIDRTPNPASMKLTLDESLEPNTRFSYTPNNIDDAPQLVQSLFDIDGIISIFHAANFMTVDRDPNADWEEIIPQIEAAFQQHG